MENWRRQKWDNHRQEVSRRNPPQHKKPPRGSWQPRVASWEKEFCQTVGSLDWETFLQMKKFTVLYSNVLEWDDSAGEEAFHEAKKRFWAKKRGLTYNAPLPDPNLYIDEIDWNSEIDPKLLSFLEGESDVPSSHQKHEPVVIFGDSLLAEKGFSPGGWGDEDLKLPADESPGNYVEHEWGNADYGNNSWHVSDASGAPGHGRGGWNDMSGQNNSCGGYNCEMKPKNFEDKKAYNARESWGVTNMVRVDDSGREFSRYRTPRFQGNENHKTHLWWKGEGRWR